MTNDLYGENMPFYLIKKDIVKMKCDAVVNAVDNTMTKGGYTHERIRKAAGRKLDEQCRAVQYCAGTDTPAMFEEMSKTLLSFRRTGRVRKNWAENISHDTDNKPKK